MTFPVLLRRLLRHHLRIASLMTASACAFAVVVTAAATVVDSSRAAISQSIVAENGGFGVSIQVVDRDRLLPVLARVDGILAVRDSDVTVSDVTGTATSPARERQADTDRPLGVLVTGRPPLADGEATLSTALARALTVHVSDDVVIDGEPLRVTGITRDPADRRATTVVVHRDVPPQEATLWLTSRQKIDSDAELTRLLDDRAGTTRTMSLLAEERAGSSLSSSALVAAAAIPAAASALLVLVLIGFTLLLSPLARRHADALAAAGWSRRRAWQLVGMAGLVCITTGLAVGTAATLLIMSSARSHVSRLLGQDWTGINVPWTSLTLLAVAVGVVTAIVAAVPQASTAIARPVTWAPPQRVAIVSCAAAALVVIAVVTNVVTVYLGALACAALAALIFVALDVIGAPRSTATVSLARHLRRHLVPLGIVVCLVTFATSFWPGYVVHNSRALASLDVTPQPPGSYVLTEVPGSASETLLATYRELGGSDALEYRLPVESVKSWRVTGTRLVRCLSDSGGTDPAVMPEDCYPQDTSSPVNIVALVDHGPTVADPGLIEAGMVGLVQFAAGEPGALQQLAQTEASSSGRLGGNLPGLVTAMDSRVAKKLELVPSDARMLAFFDFSTLSVEDRARFRALTTRIAPAAQVAELGVDDDMRAAQLARWVAAGGGVTSAVLIALVGTAVIQAQSQTRRLLADLNPTRRVRYTVAALWISPLLAGVLISAGLGRGAAWLASVHLPGTFGTSWMLPGALGAAAAICLVITFARTPPRRPE